MRYAGWPTLETLNKTDYHVNTKRKHTEEIMKTREAVQYFGGVKKLADALGIWPHNISRWGDDVPKARAFELEVKTGGKLRAEDENTVES